MYMDIEYYTRYILSKLFFQLLHRLHRLQKFRLSINFTSFNLILFYRCATISAAFLYITKCFQLQSKFVHT